MTPDLVTMLAGALFFSLLWALAALHKFTHWRAYRDQLRDYRVLPDALLPACAVALPLAEAALALAWQFEACRAAAALASALLLAAYGAAMAFNLAQGRDNIECGCGGDGQGIRWGLVSRNGVLALAALPVLWLAPAAPRQLAWLDCVTLAGAGLGLYAFYLIVNQLLANNPPQRLAR